jgi:hypothetical protein
MVTSTIIVNYTCGTRELHNRDFFLIAELPEAYLHAMKRHVPKRKCRQGVRNEKKTSFLFFQKCMLLSKKSLNVTEEVFRRWLGGVSNTTSSAYAAGA